MLRKGLPSRARLAPTVDSAAKTMRVTCIVQVYFSSWMAQTRCCTRQPAKARRGKDEKIRHASSIAFLLQLVPFTWVTRSYLLRALLGNSWLNSLKVPLKVSSTMAPQCQKLRSEQEIAPLVGNIYIYIYMLYIYIFFLEKKTPAGLLRNPQLKIPKFLEPRFLMCSSQAGWSATAYESKGRRAWATGAWSYA